MLRCLFIFKRDTKIIVENVQDGISSVQSFTPLTSDVGLVRTEHDGHFLHISFKLNYENL